MDLHSFRVFAVASSTGTGMFQTKRAVRARYDIPTVLYDKSAMNKKRDDRTSHSYRLSLSCPVSVTILSCYFRSLAPAVLCNRIPRFATLRNFESVRLQRLAINMSPQREQPQPPICDRLPPQPECGLQYLRNDATDSFIRFCICGAAGRDLIASVAVTVLGL